MTIPKEQATQTTVLDDVERHVAGVYAEAFLAAAQKQGRAAEVLDELEGLVHDVFARDPAIEVFLASAAVGRERKKEALRQAFQGRASDLLTNFLYVLNEHDRLSLLRAVASSYREQFDRLVGRMRVRLTSAAPLAGDQQDRLRQELQVAFGREPILDVHVDPELLGGMVVQVDDWVYDASVRTRLDNLSKQLIERSSYEIQSGRNRFRD
jgi:F-type H+-transporting ATPase subunit delta